MQVTEEKPNTKSPEVVGSKLLDNLWDSSQPITPPPVKEPTPPKVEADVKKPEAPPPPANKGKAEPDTDPAEAPKKAEAEDGAKPPTPPETPKEEEASELNEVLSLMLEEFDIALPEDGKLTPYMVLEKVRQYIPQTIESTLEHLLENAGKWGETFLRHLKTVKSEEDVLGFFREFATKELLFDIDTPEGQAQFMKSYLKEHMDMDEDEAQERVLELESKGTLEGKAKSAYVKVTKTRQVALRDKKLKELKEAEANEAKQAEAQRQFNQKLQKVEAVNGRPISEAERIRLIKYGSSENARADFQKYIANNPDNYFAFLDLLKNKFDLSKITTKAAAKQETPPKKEAQQPNSPPKPKDRISIYDFVPSDHI